MELSNMNLADVVERLAQLDEEVRAAGVDDIEKVNEATELKRSLLERKAELEDLEKRQAEAAALTEKEVQPETIIEERKEEKIMETNYTVASAEYRSAWAKNLQGNQLSEVEERAFALVGVDGAVPETVSNKFFEKLTKLAPMISEITLLKVAGNVKFAVEGVRDKAAKHTENASITAGGNDTMITVTLGAVEFAKLISISKAVKAMAAPQFEDWLVELLSGDIARAIDDYIINDSTNGIAGTAGSTIVSFQVSGAYTYGSVMQLIANLPAAYDPEAKFLMNKATLFNGVKNICDSQNRPIFDPVEKTLCGYPVLIDDNVTATKSPIYLGRWADVVGNLSQDIEVESNESSGFRNGSVDFRGFACFDSTVAKTDGIVKMVLK